MTSRLINNGYTLILVRVTYFIVAQNLSSLPLYPRVFMDIFFIVVKTLFFVVKK